MSALTSSVSLTKNDYFIEDFVYTCPILFSSPHPTLEVTAILNVWLVMSVVFYFTTYVRIRRLHSFGSVCF